MIVDEDPVIRKLAKCRIMKARANADINVRRMFKVPNINLEAKSYCDMIQWNEEYSEPPLLVDYSETDLDNIVL